MIDMKLPIRRSKEGIWQVRKVIPPKLKLMLGGKTEIVVSLR